MEHYICYQDENGKPAFREVTEEELSVLQPEPLTWHKEAKPFRVSIEEISAMQAMPEKSDWLHDYPLRIVAPKTLALDYPQFYVWFLLNDLPMEKVLDSVHIYINEIMPEHQVLIDNLNGVVTIEKRYGTNH